MRNWFNRGRDEDVQAIEADLEPFRRLLDEELELVANSDGPYVEIELNSGERVFVSWADASWASEWYAKRVEDSSGSLGVDHSMLTKPFPEIAGMALDRQVDTLTVWGLDGQRSIFEIRYEALPQLERGFLPSKWGVPASQDVARAQKHAPPAIQSLREQIAIPAVYACTGFGASDAEAFALYVQPAARLTQSERQMTLATLTAAFEADPFGALPAIILGDPGLQPIPSAHVRLN